MRVSYGTEALLASSIPDLELHSGALNVQGADFLIKKGKKSLVRPLEDGHEVSV